MHSWLEVESALNKLIAVLSWEFAPKYSSYQYKLKTRKNNGYINDLNESVRAGEDRPNKRCTRSAACTRSSARLGT